MSSLVDEIKSWASNKTLAAHESLFLLGSCADQSSKPSDLDILWISDRPMPESWQKELYVVSGLSLDICGAPLEEIKAASLFSHHPLSFIALAVKNQALLLQGNDIRPALSPMEADFIKEVRSLQAFREWMNYLEFRKNKYLKKTILGLAIAKGLIPADSGRSKVLMEKSFVTVSGELQKYYQSSEFDRESEKELSQEIISHCYPDFLINRTIMPSWLKWDLNQRLISLLPIRSQVQLRAGEELVINELRKPVEMIK